jgi:hypothetical protein
MRGYRRCTSISNAISYGCGTEETQKSDHRPPPSLPNVMERPMLSARKVPQEALTAGGVHELRNPKAEDSYDCELDNGEHRCWKARSNSKLHEPRKVKSASSSPSSPGLG